MQQSLVISNRFRFDYHNKILRTCDFLHIGTSLKVNLPASSHLLKGAKFFASWDNLKGFIDKYNCSSAHPNLSFVYCAIYLI